MKKRRLINLFLTSVMLLSSVLTPQMAHVVASTVNGENAEDTEQVNENDMPDVDAEKNEDGDDTDGEADAGEVRTEYENDEDDVEDEKAPQTEGEAADKTPEGTRGNDPPTDTEEESEDVEEDVDTEEESDEHGIVTFGETLEEDSSEPVMTLQAQDLGNIFTNPRLSLNEEEIQNGDIIEIDDGTIVQLEYDWNTAGLEAANGDSASIQLPAVFQQVNIQNQPVITDDVTVGSYSIVDGLLTITFNEEIEEGNVENGVLGLNLQFDMEVFEENIEQVIMFNDRDETTLNVVARPDGVISGITKEGHPDRDRDAREITWTIDVMNDNEELISNANLSDILPEGLGTPRDFEINELSIGLNGDNRVGAEASNEVQVDGNEFSIDLLNIAPFSGYRVQYTTTIEDYTADSFTNNALFSYGDTELPAKATVDGLERSNPIQKSGRYVEADHQINWTITVNESGGEITEAIIDDTLPAEQSLVEGSIVVNKYDSDWNWLEETTIDETDFPINLGGIESDEIYQIAFSADIDWSQVNDGEYQHHNQFTNETELRDGYITVGEDNATVDHWRESLLEKSGASNVDYDNNTLTWTVEVNKAKHPLTNVVVNDVIPEGLSISEENISITDEDNEAYGDATTSVDGQNVEINLGDIGTETITITYTTTITDFTIDEFDNQATLGGDGIGEGEPGDNATIRPPANSFDKSFTGINYNTRTMDWNLTVNPIREAVTELTIVDTFPNRGMIMLPDTLKIKVGGEEVTEGFTLTPNTEAGEEGYHKGFIIEFDEPLLELNARMEITYQTSYDPQLDVEGNTLDPHVGGEERARNYINHAQFTGETEHENEFDTGRNANTTVREDSWNSGKKEGQLVHEDSEGNTVNGWESGEERKIAWQLYTNYQDQDLGTGVVIEDELDYEGTIDEDSVVVSVYTVDAAGETTITNEILSDDNYKVDYNGDSFKLTFNDNFTLDERYVVQFTTTVPNISRPNYTNDATVWVGEDDYPYSRTVNYDRHDIFLQKGAIGVDDDDQVFTGDEIDWEVTVNESLSIIHNPTITDMISEGLVYVEDSLEIATASGTVLEQGRDYTLTVSSTDENETVLYIELADTLTETLILNYNTVVTETEGQVNNTINLDGENLEIHTLTSQVLSAREFSWVSGDFTPNRGALRVTKVDSEENVTIENNEATFILEFELNDERVQFGDEFTTENGILEIGGLPLRTYYLREVAAPTGYVIDEEEKTIEVTEPYGTQEHVYEVNFTNTIEKTDITVTKEWDDADDQAGFRPESVEVQLLPGNQTENPVVTLSEENDWSHTWTELNAYYSHGEEINYTVQENNVPDEYEVATDVAEDGNIVLTNIHEPETIEVSVSKEWEDTNDQDGIRPSNVIVNVLNNNEVVTQAVLDESNNWAHTFTDLPKFENGEEIQYRVTENSVAHYSTDITTTSTADGLESVISNRYTPEETSATVNKLWDDRNNQDGIRPNSIVVQLLANGEPERAPVTITAADNWTHTWDGLDLNAGGEEIQYTVEEIEAPGDYEVSINNQDRGNLMITNSYEPATIDIPVSKEWEDGDDQDGVRPDNVTVNLLANGEIERATILNADNDWQHTFNGLPVYANGNEITYTVTENSVAAYSTNIEEDPEAENGFVITNSYTPDQTSVTVTKAWDDSNNQDGNRPNSIFLQLNTVDEEELTPVGVPVEVFAADNWTYTWSGLDANADGEAIEYTVTEVDASEDYEVSVNDADHGNIIITNSYTPELTEVPVLKVWDDANNQDGERPSNITLNLLNDRSEIVRQAVVQAQEGNEWEYTFTNLPKYENGAEINYSVTENFVSDYSTEIEENEEGVQVVTNNYTPEETSVTVTKGWNDGSNQDGNRPDSIQVQLLANGEPHGEPVNLTAADGWTYTWNELDLNADGEPINYSVEELDVSEEYEVSVNDRDHGNILLTNHYDPEVIEIPVQKIWDDEENQDGIRPERVEVNLLADGEKVSEAHITEATDWQHVFTNLPRFNAGEEINYTLNENTVEHYSLTNNEFNEDTGRYELTNSYTPEETTVTVTKAWEDANNQDGNRPENIAVQLLADCEPEGEPVEITAEEDWTYTWEDLALNSAGEPITYSVQELNISDEYDVHLNDDDYGNIMLTNNYDPELIEISGTKIWEDADNQDGIRPEAITVNLLADGEVVDSTRVTAADNWTFEFTEMPRFAEGEVGVEVEYTLEEEVVEGYEVSIDGYDITNSYTPEVIDITGSKIWDDADNQDGIRPESITVNLLANGVEVNAVEVTAEDNWSYTFEDLPKFEAGEEITYTVTENTVEDYTPNIEGYTITNAYTPEETGVTVTKAWDDHNNQDGKRPDSIEVQLMANEEDVEEVAILSEEDNWTYTWSGLPLNENGEPIQYSVREASDLGEYTVEIDEENHGNIILTNSYTPEVMDIAGTKSWEDADNQDGIRPAEITVHLLANGVQIDSQTVTAEEDWSYVFEDLPRFENQGEEIEYTVEEEAVEGYEATYEGYDIINRHTPAVIDIAGTKIWDDADNQDGVRPQAITVRLMANGEEIDSVEVTEESDWTFEFSDLSRFENGEKINYTVQEDAVENYSTIIDGFEIVNSYTPGQTSVNVVKSWNDNNNVVARPESITVNLLANGVQIDSVELTAKNNWQADFTELDEYADGELIEYTVEEDTPRGFVTEGITGNAGDGFVITNRPAKVSVGDYVWFDANKDGLQDNTDVPLEGVVLTITDEEGNPVTDVYGNPVGPTVTDRNGWYTFDNLPIDNTYIVRINREAFEALYPEYMPTLTEEGDDRSIDSSEWIAISVFLDEDGQRDPTLDFGFVLREEEPEDPEDPEDPTGELPETPGSEEPGDPEDPTDPEDPEDEDLPTTGEAVTYSLLAATLIGVGGLLVLYDRKRSSEANKK